MPSPDASGMPPFDPSVVPQTSMSTNLLGSAATAVSQALVYMGTRTVDNPQGYRITGEGTAVKNPGTETEVSVTPEQFLARFDDSSREDFLKLRNMMIAAGIVAPDADPYTVRGALGSVLGQVSEMYAQGIKITPNAYINNLIRMNGIDPKDVGANPNFTGEPGGPDGDLNGDGIPDDFTGTKKGPIQKSVSEISEGQAWATLRGTVSQMLGHDPSDQELRDFTYRMNSMAASNPSISRTIAKYKNGEVVSTSTHTDPGFTADDMAQETYDQAQNDPQYAEYQAATTYFNAAQSAIGAIGNV